jgi:BirA family biotin operon repressor/biotin-[acetyl-CoA-carboxylase] ligase
VNDRKVGGVLCEASWAGSVPRYLVVGIGLNVRQRQRDFPQELRAVAASLEGAAGREFSRLALADLVIVEVEDRCANPPARLDRDCLREFDERDWLRDRRCAIERDDARPRRGTAVGIAPDGALLFRPDRGPLERVTSGRIVVDELRMPEY